MAITKVTGSVCIEVDDVDIEQTCIKHPEKVRNFSPALKAMAAALDMEDTVCFHNQLRKLNLTLVYRECFFHARGRALVIFDIIKLEQFIQW